MGLDLIDRDIEITQADNGYVLKFSGATVEVDEDGYERKEYVRCVEVYKSLSEVYAKLLELDQVDIDA